MSSWRTPGPWRALRSCQNMRTWRSCALRCSCWAARRWRSSRTHQPGHLPARALPPPPLQVCTCTGTIAARCFLPQPTLILL